MQLRRGGIRQFWFLRPHRDLSRGWLRESGLRCRRRFRLRRDRGGTSPAQIAFDHRQPIDHMAERAVNGFKRILGMTVSLRLAETEIGQFALDDIEQAAVCGVGRPAAAFCQGGKVRTLGFEMAQNVLQPVLDPSEIAGTVIGGRIEAFEQIRHALFEMGERGCTVVAGRYAIEAVGQCPQRPLEMFGAFAGCRRLAAFQRRGQRGDALFEDRKRIAVVFRTGKLIDFQRQRVDVLAEPDQRVVGRDIGNNCAKRGDGAFELLDSCRDRRRRAKSDRAWHRDCGSPRRSQPVALRASASAKLRGFHRARVRCRPARVRRRRFGGCRRYGGTASGFRSRSIRSPGAASPR